MVDLRPNIIIILVCIYRVKITYSNGSKSTLQSVPLWIIDLYPIIQHIEHLTENVTRTFINFIFQGFIILFACIVLKGGTDVTHWMAVSFQWKEKFTAYFLVKKSLLHRLLLALAHTQVKRHSITANMNQLYFLAACKDILPLGCKSLITCNGSRPYKLSKICAELEIWFVKDHFLSVIQQPQTFTEKPSTVTNFSLFFFFLFFLYKIESEDHVLMDREAVCIPFTLHLSDCVTHS